jgi:hypothetical protein
MYMYMYMYMMAASNATTHTKKSFHSKIKRFLERIGSPSNDTDVKAFLDKRPDGVAFDETKKKVCLLESIRAMDAREEWARSETRPSAMLKF